jgi:hypothetical protein
MLGKEIQNAEVAVELREVVVEMDGNDVGSKSIYTHKYLEPTLSYHNPLIESVYKRLCIQVSLSFQLRLISLCPFAILRNPSNSTLGTIIKK